MMTKCYFCGGGIASRRIRHVHEWGPAIYVIENVPAEVCTQCGEEYFSPDVLRRIDGIVNEKNRAAQSIQVPVLPF